MTDRLSREDRRRLGIVRQRKIHEQGRQPHRAGTEKPRKKAASRNVASRLLLTAGRQAGSSGSPSARAEASTRASSGSPPSALRLPAVLTAALAAALAAVLAAVWAAVLAEAFLVAVARDARARDVCAREVFAREVLGFLLDSDLARFVAIAIVVSDPVEGRYAKVGCGMAARRSRVYCASGAKSTCSVSPC